MGEILDHPILPSASASSEARFEPRPIGAQRPLAMDQRCRRRRFAAKQAVVDRAASQLASLATASPPQLDPPAERADQPAHGLAQRRVADPELPVLGVHRLDEPLGQRHRGLPRVVAAALQPNGRQRDDGRKHREAAVDRVRHLTFDIPVRLPRFADQRIEQRAAAARRRR